MSKVLVNEQYLKDIGNAIRTQKNESNTTKYRTNVMAEEIRNLKVETPVDTDIEDYVWQEAFRVSDAVKSVRRPDSLILACFGDIHYNGDAQTPDPSIQHTSQALDLVRKNIGLDAVCMMGDIIDGFVNKNTATAQISFVNSYFKNIYDKTIQFRLNGNHDILTRALGGEFFSSEELYNLIGKYNTTDCTYSSEKVKHRNYGYHDFENQKIRLIYLNTCDSSNVNLVADVSPGNVYPNCRISSAQLRWFAGALDLSGKEDASSWSIITLGHHPLNFYYGKISTYTDANNKTWGIGCHDAVQIIDAYNNGQAVEMIHYSGCDDWGEIEGDFEGKNQAKYIGHIHGHVHSYFYGEFGTTAVKPKEIAIPNIKGRTQSRSGGPYEPYQGDTFTLIPGTAEDTSFCIVVINPTEQKIYCFHYGAGKYREISYASEQKAIDSLSIDKLDSQVRLSAGDSKTFSVTFDPLDTTQRNLNWTWAPDEQKGAQATIIPGAGSCTVKALTAGTGVLTVTSVEKPSASDSITVVVTPSGELNDLFNADGNAETDKRLSLTNGSLSDSSNYITSGYMPITKEGEGHLLYLQHKGSSHPLTLNLDESTHDNKVFAAYNSEKVTIVTTYVWNYGNGQPRAPAVSNGEITYDSDDGILIIPLGSIGDNYSYYRICLPGTAVTDWAAYIDQDPRDYEDLPLTLDSIAQSAEDFASLSSAVETIAETYLDYEDDPEIVIEPEWEAHIGTIDDFFSSLKENLEETYTGGEQNVNA